jgi:hypothetical protein
MEKRSKYITTSAFPEPNYTQTPNNFFDMLPDMENSEVKVTLVMIRNTFGFHRSTFKMGINKLAEATGLSRNAVKDGAEAAENRGTFRRTNPEEQTEAEWELVVGQPVTTLNQCPSDGQPVTNLWSTSDQQVGVKESIKENKEIDAKASKPDLVDGILKYSLPTIGLKTAVTKYFPFNVNWETKYARQWLEWAHGENITPEQIQRAAETWKSDKAFNWQQPSLRLLFEKWPALMQAGSKSNQPKFTVNSDGSLYV